MVVDNFLMEAQRSEMCQRTHNNSVIVRPYIGDLGKGELKPLPHCIPQARRVRSIFASLYVPTA